MPIAINGSGSITGLTKTGISAQPVFPGNILQVINVGYSTYTTIASTTLTDTGLTASITPSASSNKILVVVSLAAAAYRETTVASLDFNIVRNSTQVRYFERGIFIQAGNNSGAVALKSGGLQSLIYLDSPTTTSSTSYKVQAKVSNAANNALALINDYAASEGFSSMTLLEVAA